MPVLALVISSVLWGGGFVLIRTIQSHGVSPALALLYFYVGAVLPLLAWTVLARKWRWESLSRAWLPMLASAVIAISINYITFLGLKLSTASEGAAVYRVDILFAAMLGYLFLRERIRPRELAFVPVMALGVVLMVGFNPASMDPRQVGNLLILAAAFLLSLNALVVKLLSKQASTEMIASFNWIVGSAFFLTLAVARKEPLGTLLQPTPLVLGLVLAVVIAIGLNCYYYGLRLMELWRARIIMLLTPATSIILERVFLHETLGRRQLVGIILTLAGATGLALMRRNSAPGKGKTPGGHPPTPESAVNRT